MTNIQYEFEDIKKAYLKLKRDIYYDQVNLFLRKKIAEFECQNDFESKLNKLAKVLNRTSNSTWYKYYFAKLYEEIDYYLLPKSLETDANDEGLITNYVNEKKYRLNKVN